ncbi:hypothetical protein [Croceicoccus marinus]|uniref:hypothetical protein n=1 Tax=Croceicoccus marinus TaxID=450378 RepID=UPI000A974C91|nr:hypothetical protein [Croceicoccus marinus]
MIVKPENLPSVLGPALSAVGQARKTFKPQLTSKEVGTITAIATGVAKVAGLPSVGFEELIRFQGGTLGIAFNVDEDEIDVVLSGPILISTLVMKSGARAG